MSSVRVGRPRSLLVTFPGVVFQTAGVFLLPFAVGGLAALAFDATQVVETSLALAGFAALLLVPVSAMQGLGVILKSWTELQYHRRRRTLDVARFFDVLHTHLGVVTAKGWSLLLLSLVFVLLALAVKWASLGVVAVLGSFLFYILMGWTVFVSTFLVRGFEDGLGRAQVGIERRVQPAVVQAGAETEEQFIFRRVPIPWGYRLLVEDPLPRRLGGVSRYVVSGMARRGEIERKSRIPRTPRGLYRLGPARLWYQDVLGITRVSIASVASAELEVLPRIRPVQIIEPPRSPRQVPDLLTSPHRFPTEDFFRFREYQPGDDARRIHWKLSMRVGALQVRVPENRERTLQDVLLVIDSYAPPLLLGDMRLAAPELLDLVVEAALALTKVLVDRGDRVRLAAAVHARDGDGFTVEELTARPGTAARWKDLGARIDWQAQQDLPAVFDALRMEGHAVVVTARVSPVPPDPEGMRSVSWVFLDPAIVFDEEVRSGWSLASVAKRLFLRPYPPGSDANGTVRRMQSVVERWWARSARRAVRKEAMGRMGRTEAELVRRGDPVYRIEGGPGGLVLRGIRSGEP